MIELLCHKCNALVSRDKTYVVGCLCDPDAPTWIALQPDGKLIAMSHADYTIKEIV
jgi:hypothetical protein